MQACKGVADGSRSARLGSLASPLSAVQPQLQLALDISSLISGNVFACKQRVGGTLTQTRMEPGAQRRT